MRKERDRENDRKQHRMMMNELVKFIYEVIMNKFTHI